MNRVVIFLCICITVVAAQLAQADSTITLNDGTKIATNGEMVVIKPASSTEPRMVYNTKTRVMSMVDDHEKRIMRMDETSMDKRMEQTQNQRTQPRGMPNMSAILDMMPPDKRAAIEQQMKGGGFPGMTGQAAKQPEPIKVVDMKQDRKINSWNCHVYQNHRGEQAIDEMCMASHRELGISKADYKAMRDLFKFMNKMSQKAAKMSASLGGTPGGSHFPLEVEGLPVWSKDFSDNDESKMDSVSDASVAKEWFAFPDYPVMNMGSMMTGMPPGAP